jgi:hypothetical protein
VRRGLAADPDCIPLLDGHELAWLALRIAREDYDLWKESHKPDGPSLTQKRVKTRLSRWKEHAQSFSTLICGIAQRVEPVKAESYSIQLGKQRRVPDPGWELVTGHYAPPLVENLRSADFNERVKSASTEIYDELMKEIARFQPPSFPFARHLILDLSPCMDYEYKKNSLVAILMELQRLMPGADDRVEIASKLGMAIETGNGCHGLQQKRPLEEW